VFYTKAIPLEKNKLSVVRLVSDCITKTCVITKIWRKV